MNTCWGPYNKWESFQRVYQLENLISQLNTLIFDIRQENGYLRTELTNALEEQKQNSHLIQQQEEYINAKYF